MDSPRILIADPDAARRADLHGRLEREGFDTVGASSWSDALAVVRRGAIAVVVASPALPGLPSAPEKAIGDLVEVRGGTVAILTDGGVGGPADPSRPLPPRLFEIVPPGVDATRLVTSIRGAVRHRALLDQVDALRSRLRTREGFDLLVGRSKAMNDLRDRIGRLAAEPGPVLVVGEDGTGRTLVARAWHEESGRTAAPFVVVHAPAFAPDRVEHELFGQEASGRPGAGAVEAARGGTLVIDEIVAVPMSAQARLARCLVPATGPDRLELAASTVRDPRRALDEGLLDPALAAAFADRVVRVPPLRERLEDAALLARHVLDSIAEINGLPPIRLTSAALAAIEGYAWPGNVRELRNALEQAAILCSDGTIAPADLPERVLEGSDRPLAPGESRAKVPGAFRDAKRRVVGEFERRYLSDLMARNAGNVTAAAAEARMLRSALQRLLRKHRLRSSDFRSERKGVRSESPSS